MVWLVEDKNTLLLCRTQGKPPRRLRAKPKLDANGQRRPTKEVMIFVMHPNRAARK